MERTLLHDLETWKDSDTRKPLILTGARQVGKTWLIKRFGKKNYHNIAYFNFDEDKELCQLFENTKNVERILDNLSLATGQQTKTVGRNTLIVFDEIQECPNALNSLKYFYENANHHHVVCAGSLLGIALSKESSFPVGKVDFLHLEPLTFTEFLMASGDKNLVEYMNLIDSFDPIPDVFFNPLSEKLKSYYVTGGMPEPVSLWINNHDIEQVQTALNGILLGYEYDFARHAKATEYPKITQIWQSIPSQLSRENKKFLYKAAREGARAREYEDAIQWLVKAGLVRKLYRLSAPRMPLSAYDDISAFKLYLLDVGLLRRLARLAPTAFGEGNRLFTEFKGALTENYALQSLASQFEDLAHYWAVDNPRYEVDFIVQRDNHIIPIEVKSDENVSSKSLRRYRLDYADQTPISVRLSLKNLGKEEGLLNIPLFLTDNVDRLLGIALG